MNYQIWTEEGAEPILNLNFEFQPSESRYFSTVLHVDFATIKKLRIGRLLKKTSLKIDGFKSPREVSISHIDQFNQSYVFSSSQNNFERLSSGKHKYSHAPPKSSEKPIEDDETDTQENENMLPKLVSLVVFGLVIFWLYFFLKRYNLNKFEAVPPTA